MPTPLIPPSAPGAFENSAAEDSLGFIDSVTDLSGAAEGSFDATSFEIGQQMNTDIAAHPLRSPTLGWRESGDDPSSLLNLDFAPLDESASFDSAFIQDRISRPEPPVQLVNMKMLEEPALPAVQQSPSILDAIPNERPSSESAPSTPGDVLEEEQKYTAFTPARLPSVSRVSELERRVTFTDAADELRPSMEEYKKLSSKEKRQLRNKISARNFRNRRKEYISLLEEQVADRDSVIDGLREQISTLSLQNKQLRDEVRALQSRSLASVDMSKFIDALRAQDGSAAPNSPRLSAQVHKDMSNSTQYASPFWGGIPPKTPTLVA
ncbi:hypothetical protein MCUN1_001113 [Malassezia cuniculi]|uniref:BZIP domain-containing protein n=1 Tax=Malassezia cuniculi TaxID=948313 RepID=A0AAF0JAG3_9BASI|nr:hypothetical protein MCUN1_001113 [Malassezia cuniculi]